MRFASPFQEHAVLQRDKPIPVWGWAGPNEEVVVRLGGAAARMTTGTDGRWLVRLPAMPAGGPHELVAASRSGETRLGDILIGEVWIASGQSNMAFTLAESLQASPEEESNLPRMRLLNVNTPALQVAQSDVCARWELASHAALSGFSAVAGWFGRILHRELGVPVGLICNAWGGTRIQAWTSREALVSHPLGLGDALSYENYAYRPAGNSDKEFGSMAEWEAHMAARDTGNAGLAKGWAAAGFDDRAWKTMTMPARWQDYGHAGSGVFWFRRGVRIPAAWRGRDLELRLGALDKHDDTYVGGERVGGSLLGRRPEHLVHAARLPRARAPRRSGRRGLHRCTRPLPRPPRRHDRPGGGDAPAPCLGRGFRLRSGCGGQAGRQAGR